MTMTPDNDVPDNRFATRLRAKNPNYAWMFLVSFLFFLVVLVLLIQNAARLSQFGLQQQVYYLVLILMGLTAAAFLFGVLRSTATWAGNVLGGVLRLSGSIVGTALVVIGGYFLVPKTTYFPFTIYVHGEAGPQDIVLRDTGRVFLKLGPEISSEQIGENGQAVFPRVPTDFRGQQVAGWVESDEYYVSSQTVTLAGSSIDLRVKKRIKHFKLSGAVMDEDGNFLPGVHVMLPAYHLEDTTGRDGSFDFELSANREEMVDLSAEKEGYQTVRLSPTLGDLGVNFSLKRK